MAQPTYRFDAADVEGYLAHLESEGFCVIKGVASPEDVGTINSLFWDWLESCSRSGAIRRDDPSSWTEQNNWPGGPRGFLTEANGGGQCAAAWHTRTLPGVRRAFESIWNTSELLVSFDAIIGWRPWEHRKAQDHWRPVVEGFHIDQNPVTKPGKQCVQGMMPLRAVTPGVGGLAVLPKSHLDEFQTQLRNAHQWWSAGGDWCVLKGQWQTKAEHGAVLLETEPGDLILWDSRLVHGG